MINIQKISIDIVNPNILPPPILRAKQFDSARAVECTIYEDGVLLDAISSDDAEIAVIFKGAKNSGTTYIDGIKISNGIATFLIPQNALSKDGMVSCELQIISNVTENEVISSMNFFIDVEKSLYSDDMFDPHNVGNPIEKLVDIEHEIDVLNATKQGAITTGKGVKMFNVGEEYAGESIQKGTTLCVLVDLQNIDFAEDGSIKLSDAFLSDLSQRLSTKQDVFELTNEALEFVENENGTKFLRVKTGNEIYSNVSGLTISTGYGLRHDEQGRNLEVNTDVIANKDYVNSLVSGAVKRKVVEQLPTENIDLNTIYMVLADVVAENNIYNEFMYINEKWEQIGSTAVDLSGYATLDDLETKENKLVGGNAITISEAENEGEKRTVVSVDSTSVVLRGQYDTDMATKAKKSKLEPIRTVIIGDETTYQDADIISYSDEEATQVQKIAICVDDNGKPFHLKETWIKSYLPSRTDTTSSYKFVCFPYTFVSLNSSGMPTSSTGMKLCNHIVDVSTLTTEYCNQCYAKFDDEANAYYGFDTGNYARSSVDTMTTWRSWGVNPKMIQDNAWGNTQRSVMCNGTLVSSKPEDVPLATGTKIEIYGVRKDED